MCFRFQQKWASDEAEGDLETLLGLLFGIESIPGEFIPASNIALTDSALVVTNEIPRRAEMQRFSIIPYGTREPKRLAVNMFANATREKVATSNVWKTMLEKRRCLIPVSGFYDWVAQPDKTKVPYMAYVPGEKMFSLAGIWDRWIEPETQKEVHSFAIITSPPNDLWARIHNRMPVIMPKQKYEDWLSPGLKPRDALDLLNVFPSENMAYKEFSKSVNSSKNKDESTLQPVGEVVTA